MQNTLSSKTSPSSRLRVTHLNSSLGMGGAETLIVDLIESSLTTTDIEMSVVLINNVKDSSLMVRLHATGVRVACIDRPPGGRNPLHYFAVMKGLFDQRPDIIHSHNTFSHAFALAFRLFMPRVRIVHTVHDVRIYSDNNLRLIWLRNRMTACFAAISRAVAKDLHDCGIKPVVQINNGVNIKRFWHELRPHSNNGPLRIINVARLDHDKKGQDVLIEAIGKCHANGADILCQLVGGNIGDDRRSQLLLEDLIEKLHLRDCVQLLGSRSDVPALLKAADIFVLPSRFEGFGLVLIEAMAAGLPVIATAIDGPAELIHHGYNGLLVPPNNPAALAAAILHLANDPNLRKQLAKQGQKTAQNYTIEVMREQYLGLYRQIIKRGS